LGLFLALLLDANRSFNLTAIRDPDEAWTRHILDSLTLLPLLADLEDGARIIDVGTGGGLPGIPLAIVLPRLRITLLEATGKKAAFLQRTIEQLGLANIEIVNERAERVGQDRGGKSRGSRGGGVGGSGVGGGYREAYDVVTARALGRLATGAELTVPLARVGGRVLLFKGRKADEELAEAASALHLLKAVHVGTHDTPTGRIVVLEKHARTPRMYPRRDGEPKRSPL
jgi:16S rRNA (guanine527-N7)-methyltransferase